MTSRKHCLEPPEDEEPVAQRRRVEPPQLTERKRYGGPLSLRWILEHVLSFLETHALAFPLLWCTKSIYELWLENKDRWQKNVCLCIDPDKAATRTVPAELFPHVVAANFLNIGFDQVMTMDVLRRATKLRDLSIAMTRPFDWFQPVIPSEYPIPPGSAWYNQLHPHVTSLHVAIAYHAGVLDERVLGSAFPSLVSISLEMVAKSYGSNVFVHSFAFPALRRLRLRLISTPSRFQSLVLRLGISLDVLELDGSVPWEIFAHGAGRNQNTLRILDNRIHDRWFARDAVMEDVCIENQHLSLELVAGIDQRTCRRRLVLLMRMDDNPLDTVLQLTRIVIIHHFQGIALRYPTRREALRTWGHYLTASRWQDNPIFDAGLVQLFEKLPKVVMDFEDVDHTLHSIHTIDLIA